MNDSDFDDPNLGLTEALGEHADNPERPTRTGDTVVTGWCEECGCAVCNYEVGPDGSPTGEEVGECPACGAFLGSREWLVPANELRLKAQFEQWVRRRAQLAYEALDGGYSEEADKLRSVYMADFAAGHYSWGSTPAPQGKHLRAALTCPAGFYHMMFILLRRGEPSLDEESARRAVDSNPKRFAQALAWSMGNSHAPSERRPAAGAKLTARRPERAVTSEARKEVRKPVTAAELAALARQEKLGRAQTLGGL